MNERRLAALKHDGASTFRSLAGKPPNTDATLSNIYIYFFCTVILGGFGFGLITVNYDDL